MIVISYFRKFVKKMAIQQQQQQLKFSKELFLELDLANLLINIWSYADYLHDFVINEYCQYCIEGSNENWDEDYLDFHFVIKKILNRNTNFFDFGEISSSEKNIIYTVIRK